MDNLARTTPVLRRRALYHAGLFASFSLFWTTTPLLLASSEFGLPQGGIALFALAGLQVLAQRRLPADSPTVVGTVRIRSGAGAASGSSHPARLLVGCPYDTGTAGHFRAGRRTPRPSQRALHDHFPCRWRRRFRAGRLGLRARWLDDRIHDWNCVSSIGAGLFYDGMSTMNGRTA